MRGTNKTSSAVKSVPSIVKPELMVWARTARGWSIEIAAKVLGIEVPKLEAIERGEEAPSMALVRTAASKYKRPFACFFLPSPPKEDTSTPEYRTLSGSMANASPDLRLAIREVGVRREIALDMLQLLGRRAKEFDFTASLAESPVQVARRLRSKLSIDFSDQSKAGRDSYESLGFWRTKIESFGILVFQIPKIEMETARAFSVVETHLPIIAVNSKDAPNGRIFSMLHEMIHLGLGQGAVCEGEESQRRTQRDEIEGFCNACAAEALVPTDILMDIIGIGNKVRSWQDAEIVDLSKRFGCSEEVVARRLVAMARMSQAEFSSRMTVYRGRRSTKKDGGPAHNVVVVSQLGRPLIGLVIEAYNRERITGNKVSQYLGVKLKALGELESAATSPKAGVVYA